MKDLEKAPKVSNQRLKKQNRRKNNSSPSIYNSKHVRQAQQKIENSKSKKNK